MTTISPDNMKYLRDFVYRRSAIVVEADKDYLLESRLLPVARQNTFACIDDLVQQLRREENGTLAGKVVEAMTTNETSFFRDVHPFESLKTKIIPDLLAARVATKTIRIWCAAASTGQEPYTIAMTLRECIPNIASWNIQIIGTDINATVLQKARAGTYKQLEVNRGLPAALLVKYFDRVGADWQIKQELRSMVSFQELNLLDRWPIFAQQDIVFIRNVLIYFDIPTKRKILGRIRELMRPDGYLLLGGAESTLNIDDGYAPARIGSTVCFQPKPAPEGKVANASR